jgi:hypothetical protein
LCDCYAGQVTYSSENLDGSVTLFLLAILEVTIEELVFALLGNAPKVATGPHGHINDSASPDIDGARIELLVHILLRGNVWRRTAKTSGHVSLLLPSHPEAFAISEIGDFDSSMASEQQILGLEVAMRNTHLMHVLDTTH